MPQGHRRSHPCKSTHQECPTRTPEKWGWQMRPSHVLRLPLWALPRHTSTHYKQGRFSLALEPRHGPGPGLPVLGQGVDTEGPFTSTLPAARQSALCLTDLLSQVLSGTIYCRIYPWAPSLNILRTKWSPLPLVDTGNKGAE